MNFVRLSMAVRWVCLAVLCLLLASPPPALAQTCSRTLTINRVTRNFQNCSVLGELSATIAWNFDSSNGTLEVGFTAVAASTDDVWVAWGVNPSSSVGENFMNGSGVVLARLSNGAVSTGAYDITSEMTPSIPDTPPASTQNVIVLAHDGSFDGNTGKVYAKIVWAPNSVYHGWNSGPLSASGMVMRHDPSQILGRGNLDLLTGAVTAGQVPHKQRYFNHGIVAVVGWGILIPLGIMIARYARPFQAADPAWFYSHIFFQASGFVLGLVAWILGQKLQDAAYTSSTHGAIGTAVFVFSILQVLAIVLRPGKEHKIRPYWNGYHHGVGYVAFILAIVNIFIGFHLLQQNRLPKNGYRNAYIVVLCILAAIALIMEVFTWIIYFKRRSRVPSLKMGEGSQEGMRNNYPAAYP